MLQNAQSRKEGFGACSKEVAVLGERLLDLPARRAEVRSERPLLLTV